MKKTLTLAAILYLLVFATITTTVVVSCSKKHQNSSKYQKAKSR